MLKKTKIKIGAAITTGLMGFAAIGTSVGVIENQKTNTQINNNIKTNVIKNDNLNTQSKNYSNYLKDTTLAQVENLINQKVNQQTAMFATLSQNEAKVLQYQNDVLFKSKKLVESIFKGKIKISFLLSEIKKKYKNLSKQQKEFIQNKINKEISILDHKKNSYSNLINLRYSFISNYQTNQKQINVQASQNFLNRQTHYLNLLKGFAAGSTAVSIAATAVAAIDWAIPFWGWFYAGPLTTASAVVDWTTTGFAWSEYKGLNNMYSTVSSLLLSGASIGLSITDLFATKEAVEQYIETQSLDNTRLSTLVDSAISINIAGDGANPEVNLPFQIVLDAFSTVLDLEMVAFGIGSFVISSLLIN